jgi:hypothetical protein
VSGNTTYFYRVSIEFRLAKLQVPPSRLEFAKGFPFEFELGRRMVQELGSFAKGPRDL